MNALLRSGAGALAATVVALAGCANPGGIAPQAQLRSLAPADAQDVGLAVAPEWWRDFGDPHLDRLIAQALADQPRLGVAEARWRRARALVDAAAGATLPQVNGALDLTRQHYTATGAIPAPLAGSVRESGTLQLSASWELDFFGRQRSALQAALGAERAAEADLAAARVLLAGNVARSWFQLLRLQEQLNLARRTLEQRERQLALVRQRVDAGLDTVLELRQAEGAVPQAHQQIEALREQQALARNALAVLVGQESLELPPLPPLASLKTLPVPQALPADLLGRRPDVAAARWRVAAAADEVALARTQFYPNVNLVAFAGLSSIGLGRLLDGDSRQWGIGPAVRLPVFDAGRLRANLQGRTADLDAAVETYNAALLDAVREVADQVSVLQAVQRQQEQQRLAQAAAEQAYAIALQRYQAGLASYLQVLATESAVLAQRSQAVDLAARALDAQAGLRRALGGGWRDPSRQQDKEQQS